MASPCALFLVASPLSIKVAYGRWLQPSARHRSARRPVKTQKAPLAKATDVGNTPQAKTDEKVGFIGGTGNMGSAIIRGLIETQTISPSNILSTGRDQKKLERFAVETGCTVVPDLTALCAEASTLFLCVKPAQCASVLEDLAARTGELLETKRIISVAAGVPIAALERYLQRQYPQGLRPRVLRCMPNILVRYGNGVTGITRGNFATDEDISWTEWVMGHLGVTALVDEQLLDAVVAAAGSAPAFAFMFMEALTDAAVREGLPRHVARSFVAQTLSGAAQMAVRDAETHFGELRNRVESPGGTTIAGSCALEESGFRRAVLAAAAAAAARSRALSAYFI